MRRFVDDVKSVILSSNVDDILDTRAREAVRGLGMTLAGQNGLDVGVNGGLTGRQYI